MYCYVYMSIHIFVRANLDPSILIGEDLPTGV